MKVATFGACCTLQTAGRPLSLRSLVKATVLFPPAFCGALLGSWGLQPYSSFSSAGSSFRGFGKT